MKSVKISFKNIAKIIINIGSDFSSTQFSMNPSDASKKIKYIPHQEFYGGSYEDIPRRTPDISKIKNTKKITRKNKPYQNR